MDLIKGKYYKIDPELIVEDIQSRNWNPVVNDAVKNKNQNWIADSRGVLLSSVLYKGGEHRESVGIAITKKLREQFVYELPAFTGFKEGYYYRYWRSDGKISEVNPFFNGRNCDFYNGSWYKCVYVEHRSYASFEGIKGGLWNLFYSTDDKENFHEFYQEMSPDEYYNKEYIKQTYQESTSVLRDPYPSYALSSSIAYTDNATVEIDNMILKTLGFKNLQEKKEEIPFIKKTKVKMLSII